MNRVRRAMWAAGVPARALLIASIHLYRATLSGWLGGQCRFYPSCSVYAEDAVRARGAVIGSGLAVWRILRCNPFGSGGVEPAPRLPHQAVVAAYDVVTRHEHEEVQV
jgi:putative membrane protein insertion efficiency factor